MLTTKQAALRLNLSTARVKWLAGQGRIVGAVKFGSVWAIPDDFVVTTVKKGRPVMRKTVSFFEWVNGMFDSKTWRCIGYSEYDSTGVPKFAEIERIK